MIYLASPYSHPDLAVREARFEAVCDQAASMAREGVLVYSPICHGHPLAGRGVLGDWETWSEHNRWMLGACSAFWVLMLRGWEESVGVAAELEIARSLGLSVRHLPPCERVS